MSSKYTLVYSNLVASTISTQMTGVRSPCMQKIQTENASLFPHNIPSRPFYASHRAQGNGNTYVLRRMAYDSLGILHSLVCSLLNIPPWFFSFSRLYQCLYSKRMAGTPRPPPPPRRLGTAFLPTLFPGMSTRGTPPMVLGSFIKDTSS